MATRALPVALLLTTFVLDGRGLHRASFYVLVFALAAAAVAALSVFGDLVEETAGSLRLETALSALGAVLVLVAAAARGQTATAETVPALAVSATVGALILLTPALATAALRTAAPSLRRALAR